ncbi:MAG: septum formation initiator family protein [Desulfobacteraceae bacterium]
MNHRQKVILVIVAIAMSHLMLVVLFGDNGLLELNRKHNTHQRLLEENARLTRENLKLYRAIDRLENDPDFVESVARHELGMVRPDELIFKFKSNDIDNQ